MADLDGFDICHRIRTDPDGRNLPVCMAMGEIRGEDHFRAVSAGANGFIANPLNRETGMCGSANRAEPKTEAQA